MLNKKYKTALITGAATGIGYTILKKLRQENIKVIALDKDKNRVEAIKLLETVIKRIPSADNFASDWEWIKKAKVILDDLKS